MSTEITLFPSPLMVFATLFPETTPEERERFVKLIKDGARPGDLYEEQLRRTKSARLEARPPGVSS